MKHILILTGMMYFCLIACNGKATKSATISKETDSNTSKNDHTKSHDNSVDNTHDDDSRIVENVDNTHDNDSRIVENVDNTHDDDSRIVENVDDNPNGCKNSQTYSGKISTSKGEVTFDKVEVSIQHKQDIDTVEDGCINQAMVQFFHGSGCKLEIRADTAKIGDTGIKITSIIFSADSQCPHFLDADEGTYIEVSALDKKSLTLASMKVPDYNADTSCHEQEVVISLSGILNRQTDNKELNISLSTLTINGKFNSKGSTDTQCLCKANCSNTCDNASDGCGGICEKSSCDAGKMCSNFVCIDDPCDPDPCNGNGSCQKPDATCVCVQGYKGNTCDSCDAGYWDYPTCTVDACYNNTQIGQNCGGVCGTATYQCNSQKTDIICIDPLASSPNIGTSCTTTDNKLGIYDCAQNSVLCVNRDGKLQWKFLTNKDIQSSPAIASDGTIYVGSNDQYLYAIQSDGTLKWKFQTNNYIFSSPVIASDGTIYVGSNYYLYAIYGDNGGLANSDWPKFHHDNMNTGRVP